MPRAVELAPDLVSLAAGGNDILRGTDVDELAAQFEPAVAALQAAGCRVLIFTGFDPRMFPVIRLLRGRIAAYDMHLRAIADARGCDLVDLWSMRALRDPRAWSPDRLHLTTEGHRRVALRTCEVLGLPVGRGLAGAAAAGRCPRTRTGAGHQVLGLAGRPPPGRPLGPGVRDAVGPPAAGRQLERRRRAAQAPRPASLPGVWAEGPQIGPGTGRSPGCRSARTSSRRSRAAAIQGSAHGSAAFSAARPARSSVSP